MPHKVRMASNTPDGVSDSAPASLLSAPDVPKGPTARVGHMLRRAYQFALENSARAFEDLGVTPRQAGALWEIQRHGPLSQRELGERIGMDAPNVHGLVGRLERKGLVAIAQDTRDPRRKRLTLTAEGAALTGRLPQRAQQAEESTLLALSPGERAMLVTLLERVVADSGAAEVGASPTRHPGP